MTEPVTPAVPESAPRPSPAPASPSGGGKTRLATYRPDVLIVGDHKITPKGTSVPSSEVDEIRAVAAANGVTVYEMES
jgi:hypothetical protein